MKDDDLSPETLDLLQRADKAIEESRELLAAIQARHRKAKNQIGNMNVIGDPIGDRSRIFLEVNLVEDGSAPS